MKYVCRDVACNVSNLPLKIEMEKFRDKYRIGSARLQKWDYRKDASYFITICTKNREHFFGEIENGKMQLSGAGIVANIFWHEIINHSKNIQLGQFVVMPNHIHGILILDGKETNDVGALVANTNVETLHATSLPPQSPTLPLQSITIPPQSPPDKNQFYSDISPKSNSVSTILRSYKSAVTKHVNRLNLCGQFAWQERFYDHIIRDEEEFQRIENYIQNNPGNWKEDKFFS